jgi:hypothetical protein
MLELNLGTTVDIAKNSSPFGEGPTTISWLSSPVDHVEYSGQPGFIQHMVQYSEN